MPGWWKEGDETPIAAVAICLTNGNALATHVGIVHQLSDKSADLQLIHLAWHYKLKVELFGVPPHPLYLILTPKVHRTRLEFLATRCRQVARRRPALPYGFRLQKDAFVDVDGTYQVKDNRGLTCSTFVIVLFRSAEINLVDDTTWMSRTDDVERHKLLLQILEKNSNIESEFLEKVREDLSTVRIRPEETAGCCLAPALPVVFSKAQKFGHEVLMRLLQHSSE